MNKKPIYATHFEESKHIIKTFRFLLSIKTFNKKVANISKRIQKIYVFQGMPMSSFYSSINHLCFYLLDYRLYVTCDFCNDYKEKTFAGIVFIHLIN